MRKMYLLQQLDDCWTVCCPWRVDMQLMYNSSRRAIKLECRCGLPRLGRHAETVIPPPNALCGGRYDLRIKILEDRVKMMVTAFVFNLYQLCILKNAGII